MDQKIYSSRRLYNINHGELLATIAACQPQFVNILIIGNNIKGGWKTFSHNKVHIS